MPQLRQLLAVNQRVDQFKKDVEAESQKRRVILEENFTGFARKRVKLARAESSSCELQGEQARAKNVFLTEKKT